MTMTDRYVAPGGVLGQTGERTDICSDGLNRQTHRTHKLTHPPAPAHDHTTQTSLSYFVPVIGLDGDNFYLKELSVRPGFKFDPRKFVTDRKKGATQELTKISRDDFDGLLALLLRNRSRSGNGGSLVPS